MTARLTTTRTQALSRNLTILWANVGRASTPHNTALNLAE